MASTSLAQLAESLGCVEDMAARLAVHRVERAAFRRVMRAVDQHSGTMVPEELLAVEARAPSSCWSQYWQPGGGVRVRRSGLGENCAASYDGGRMTEV